MRTREIRQGQTMREDARSRIARHVRRLRVLRGLSQERLAELADLHRTYVGAVERGERNVSVATVERLATALGVDVSELLRPTQPTT
ncbi:helix-turn-helix domain-containing protein [Rubrivivax gelatinosus]|uniref:Transcriptional regulator, Xre family n=1 Tax=Rubrivivax gelatinosus (strain NBRC 100245 / IL144) TaxID=983917 RepID=I0HLZ8_RUBGI|nr:helix-turn-helix transcriptional regulator [Rubrivivax gelatinosus]BAL94035.1 transcriptional regulator, Xre family [Rubrivivax gelatinosus IL144]